MTWCWRLDFQTQHRRQDSHFFAFSTCQWPKVLWSRNIPVRNWCAALGGSYWMIDWLLCCKGIWLTESLWTNQYNSNVTRGCSNPLLTWTFRERITPQMVTIQLYGACYVIIPDIIVVHMAFHRVYITIHSVHTWYVKKKYINIYIYNYVI